MSEQQLDESTDREAYFTRMHHLQILIVHLNARHVFEP
jgi:hypothetical protein